MADIIEITDLTRPELAVYTKLTERQLRSCREGESGHFLAEGWRVIRLALELGYAPVSFLMERRHITGQGATLLEMSGDVPVYTADREILSRLTGYALNRGFLCAMRRPPRRGVEEVCAGVRRVAVLEEITDATNVGAVFRSAAALGMDAVLVTPGCCDPLNRRALRVSMGTALQIPWAVIGEEEGWPDAMDRLSSLGFRTLALALREDAVSLEALRPGPEEKLALLLGTEGDGLSPATIARCESAVRIPMSHGVDSLNVAAAGAVAFWQLRVRNP